MNTESFERRHIGPTDIEIEKMLSLINANSIDELIDQTIPKSIRNRKKMKLDPPMSCLLYTSPSPRDPKTSRMPSSA